MRRAAVAAAAFAALAVVAVACRGRYVYDCDKGAKPCVRDNLQGTCRQSPIDAHDSYCVFYNNTSCPIGEWDATAADGLAGKCVGEEMLDGGAPADMAFTGDGSVNLAGCSTANDLYAVWGANTDDIWVVGAGSTIFHYSSGNACEVQTNGVPAGVILRAVWGRSPTDVYVAGDGVILHSGDRGETWTNSDQPTDRQYWGVGGTADATWAVVEHVGSADSGALYKSTNLGAHWSLVGTLDGDPLSAIWSNGTRTWVGGGSNSPEYNDSASDSTWFPSNTGGFSGYISGLGGNAKGVLAVTSGAQIMRYNGSAWPKLFDHGASGGGCGSGLFALSVVPGLAIAVGKVGCIAVSTDDGDTWKDDDEYGPPGWPYTADFNGVWIDPTTNTTFVVGTMGTVVVNPMMPP